MKKIEEQLLKHLDIFTAFAKKRVKDHHLAADVVQDSLLKAIKSSKQLRDGENILAWFYQIMRHTIIDLYLRKDLTRRILEEVKNEPTTKPKSDELRVACKCLKILIPTLKSDYSELIRKLDIEEQDTRKVASSLGITQNSLRVRHHRARQQLRKRLEETCRLCAKHKCLDCNCF